MNLDDMRTAIAFGLVDKYEIAIQSGSLADVLALAAADAEAWGVEESGAPDSERPTCQAKEAR